MELLRNDFIRRHSGVKNLTDAEISGTVRMLQLDAQYSYGQAWDCSGDVAKLSDSDKFHLMLIKQTACDYLLTSRTLIYVFHGTKYHWRKIGRTSPLTSVASAVSDCSTGYYGRGWTIAPHIRTLIKFLRSDFYLSQSFNNE